MCPDGGAYCGSIGGHEVFLTPVVGGLLAWSKLQSKTFLLRAVKLVTDVILLKNSMATRCSLDLNVSAPRRKQAGH